MNVKHKYLWHLSAIYCIAFDRTANYIFTGGDDGLVRIYSINDDKLITTLSDGNGLDQFKSLIENFYNENKNEKKYDVKSLADKINNNLAITELAINHENTIIAAGKYSGLILVWELKTASFLTRLDRHIFPINSIYFSPFDLNCDNRYLITTSEDGIIYFWRWNILTKEFVPETDKFNFEMSVENMCTAFSNGGLLFAVALRNGYQYSIRINFFDENFTIKELWNTVWEETHSDCFYTMKFCNKSIRFASGCNRDKNTYIWVCCDNKWTKMIHESREKRAHSVHGCVDEIVWTCDDNYVISALTDYSIKVFDSQTGEMKCKFQDKHKAKIVILVAHPLEDHLFMSAGHDGKIFIWNIINETFTRKFECNFVATPQEIRSDIKFNLNPCVIECRFSPNGKCIASGDSYGNFLLISLNDDTLEDKLDRLEDNLERIHSEDAYKCLVPSLRIAKLNDYYNLLNRRFKYEKNLLNIEKRQINESTNSTTKTVANITEITAAIESSDEESKHKKSKRLIIGAKRWKEYGRDRCKRILKQILDNPLSKPFVIVDHLEYPEYRKEIPNPDVHLSSIREEINTSDYSFARFRKDMNLVFENAKDFFCERDSNIVEMATKLQMYFEEQINLLFESEEIITKKAIVSDNVCDMTGKRKLDNETNKTNNGCHENAFELQRKKSSNSIKKSHSRTK